MLTRSSRTIGLAILQFSWLFVTPVAAQVEPPPPPLDVAVGVSYMREEWLDRDLKFGWVLSVQRHLTPRLAIVGEGGGSYAREEPFPEFFPYSMWVHSLLGGARASVISTPRANIFGQALVGWVRRTRTNPGSVVTPLNEGAVNTLGIQPGLGVEYRLSRRVTARFQADYRRLNKSAAIPRSTGEMRFMTGFGFGVERQP